MWSNPSIIKFYVIQENIIEGVLIVRFFITPLINMGPRRPCIDHPLPRTRIVPEFDLCTVNVEMQSFAGTDERRHETETYPFHVRGCELDAARILIWIADA